MLNREAYAKTIADIAIAGGTIAIKDNKPVICDGISCAKCCCDYYDSGKIQEWANSEYKEPILNEAEKRYLSAVIKPFRDKVKYICKYYNANEWISIAIKKSVNIEFPHFVKGTMYKGMKGGKKYTLEELGLWETLKSMKKQY